MGGACSADGAKIGTYRVLVRKLEGKRSLGRSRRRWEDNIRINFYETGCGVWIGLSWPRIETGVGHL
jgi:hypothetical protein